MEPSHHSFQYIGWVFLSVQKIPREFSLQEKFLENWRIHLLFFTIFSLTSVVFEVIYKVNSEDRYLCLSMQISNSFSMKKIILQLFLADYNFFPMECMYVLCILDHIILQIHLLWIIAHPFHFHWKHGLVRIIAWLHEFER